MWRAFFVQNEKSGILDKNPICWIFQPSSSPCRGLFLLLRVMTPFSILKNPIFWIFRFEPQNRPQNQFQAFKIVFKAQISFQIPFTAPKAVQSKNFRLKRKKNPPPSFFDRGLKFFPAFHCRFGIIDHSHE